MTLLGQAFGIHDGKLIEGWLELAGHESLRVVEGRDGVRAGLILLSMGQLFGGRAVPMCGVAAVAVRHDLLRSGEGTFLLGAMLEELAGRGVALSTLYPAAPAFYRKAGYEAAGTQLLTSFSPTELTLLDHELPLRQATDEDHDAVERLYREQVAPGQNGALERGRYIWSRLWGERFGVPARGVVIEDGGELLGYAYYRQHSVYGDRYRLEILDLAARTPAALRRLWSFFADLETMVSRVTYPSAPQDPVFQLQDPPRSLTCHLEPWFVRVVDLEAAVAQRGCPPGLTAEVDLEVVDELLPANAGRWRLTVENGRGEITRGGSGTVRLDIRALASIYTGFAPPSSLALAGLLDGPPEALATLGALFAGPMPWMREDF